MRNIETKNLEIMLSLLRKKKNEITAGNQESDWSVKLEGDCQRIENEIKLRSLNQS